MSETPGFAGYTPAEEIAHSLLHGLGVVLSIAGLTVLVTFASLRGDVRAVVGCSIYGATLILLYVASTLYHSIPIPRAKRVLRVLDHAAIYLLIAGTYTPISLVSLRGAWGWSLLASIWGLALLGVASELATPALARRLSLGLYLAMGWLVVIAARPLARSVAPAGIALLVLGGGAYTLGVAFYAWRRLPFNHAVWHACVLAGSVLHFFAVLLYVIPRPG
jgi:hemolysin III